MHTLTSDTVRNFRSCESVRVDLAPYTPFFSYNNADKRQHSVGTLIQARAGHKSFVSKDRKGDDSSYGINFRNQRRSNETHVSNTYTHARLHSKCKTTDELCSMRRTLTDNRHGLVVNAMVTKADGHAEREAAKAMINDVRQCHEEETTLTLGADKGYDAQEFIEALQEMNVLPHVAQNTSGRKSAVPDA